MHIIVKIVLQAVADGYFIEDYIRAMQVAERAISRLPDEDSAHMPGIVDAFNAADMSVQSIQCRNAGNNAYANRCESERDRILERYGYD